MTVSVADIIALRKQIETERKKLEERENALSVVAEMLREIGAIESPQLDLVVMGQAPIVYDSQRTFTQAVRESAHHFSNTEFTVANIETLLKGQGFTLNGKPRARISMILHNMEKEGKVIRVFRGSGNVPHRYRVNPSL